MSIIIDTDPGIDDAIALLYALRAGMDVAAITTVAGNLGLDVTTRNAGRIVAVAGASVPVHPGAAQPLIGEGRSEEGIHGDDGMGGVAFPEPCRPSHEQTAGDAIQRHVAQAGPGGVTLFCLGPLTNLARLIAVAPDAARRLGPVIAMGGAVNVPGNVDLCAEFNFAHDPVAAAHVMAAGLDLTLIPLDATRQFRVGRDFVAALRDTMKPAAMAAAALIEAYFSAATNQESRPLHDPCVPLYHARPDLFRTEVRRLDVDMSTGEVIDGAHLVKVVIGLDPAKLRDELKRGLTYQPSSAPTTARQ